MAEGVLNATLFRTVVNQLLDHVEIKSLGLSRVEPGREIELGLNIEQAAFDGLTTQSLPFSIDLSTPLSLTNLAADQLPALSLDVGSLALSNITSSLGELEVTVPDVSLNLTRVGAGPVGEADLKVVMEQVEFPPPGSSSASAVNPDATPSNALPYLVPTSLDSTGKIPVYALKRGVLGVIARAKGVINSLDRVTGALTASVINKVAGTISGALVHQANGSLTLSAVPTTLTAELSEITGTLSRQLLPQPPTVTITWKVLDENGTDLLTQGGCVRKGDITGPLATTLPTVAFVPEFVEYEGPSQDLLARRNIWCHIKVAPPESLGLAPIERDLGPIPIEVPRVPIPTVLLMTASPVEPLQDGAFTSPSSVLVAVPKRSLIDGPPTILDVLLAHGGLQQVTQRIQETLGKGGFVVPELPYLNALSRVLQSIDAMMWVLNPDVHGGRIAFAREDYVSDLAYIGYWRFGELGPLSASWYWFKNIVSSVTLFGPPRREVGCYVAEGAGEVERRGAFRLRLGLVPAATIPTLNTNSDPTVTPVLAPPTDATVEIRWAPERSRTRSFDDAISSYRFFL